MFPYTHLYCSKRIVKETGNLFLYGSIFPDIPMTGIVSWDNFKERTVEFSDFLKEKYPKLHDIGEGLLYHEEPRGIDRFVHGDAGYAYVKGRKILASVEQHFPERSLTVAHGFIEYAVEMLVVSGNKELPHEMKEVIRAASSIQEDLDHAFSEFFALNSGAVHSAITEFNSTVLEEDAGNEKKARYFYMQLTNKMRKTTVSEKIIGELLDKAVAEVKDNYQSTLELFIERCRTAYQEKLRELGV